MLFTVLARCSSPGVGLGEPGAWSSREFHHRALDRDGQLCISPEIQPGQRDVLIIYIHIW